MVFSFEKFRLHILGSHVIIHTDHVAIKYLMENKEAKPRSDGYYCYKSLIWKSKTRRVVTM